MRLHQVDGKELEAAWIGPRPDEAPTLVFLHEGLGCVSMWRDFPAKVAAATGCGALVYSRLGYGASDPAPPVRSVAYMHDEAMLVLPQVLDEAGVRDAILVGHSDGGSIAILYAGAFARAASRPRLRALVLEAPHVFVEDLSVASIAAAGVAYRETDLKARLARHHGANTDGAFRGWNHVWLDPAFRAWNIEAYLPALRVPTLAIQGEDDEYGTSRQLDAIASKSGAAVESLLLPRCRHSPHRDQPAATEKAMVDFVARVLRAT